MMILDLRVKMGYDRITRSYDLRSYATILLLYSTYFTQPFRKPVIFGVIIMCRHFLGTLEHMVLESLELAKPEAGKAGGGVLQNSLGCRISSSNTPQRRGSRQDMSVLLHDALNLCSRQLTLASGHPRYLLHLGLSHIRFSCCQRPMHKAATDSYSSQSNSDKMSRAKRDGPSVPRPSARLAGTLRFHA